VEGDGLCDSVALVEDAEHGDALRHRGDAQLAGAGGGGAARGSDGVALIAAAAAGKREGEQQRERAIHAYSGIQGS
jgi:hypothetical protein